MEKSNELNSKEGTSRVRFTRGIENLNKLIQSKAPEEEVLQESRILQPYGDRAYAGDWAWRPNENPDRSPGECKIFTPEEVKQYCQENNLIHA